MKTLSIIFGLFLFIFSPTVQCIDLNNVDADEAAHLLDPINRLEKIIRLHENLRAYNPHGNDNIEHLNKARTFIKNYIEYLHLLISQLRIEYQADKESNKYFGLTFLAGASILTLKMLFPISSNDSDINEGLIPSQSNLERDLRFYVSLLAVAIPITKNLYYTVSKHLAQYRYDRYQDELCRRFNAELNDKNFWNTTFKMIADKYPTLAKALAVDMFEHGLPVKILPLIEDNKNKPHLENLIDRLGITRF